MKIGNMLLYFLLVLMVLNADDNFLLTKQKYAIKSLKYPFLIRLDYFDNGKSNVDAANQGIRIYQYDKKVAELNATYLYDPLFKGDLDGDGYQDIVYKTFTAPSQFDLHIISIKPKIHIFSLYNLGEDINISLPSKGKPFFSFNECYGFVMSAKYACTKIDTYYNGGRLVLKPSELPDPLLLRPETAIYLDKSGYIVSKESGEVIDSISMMLDRFYSGDSYFALEAMNEYIDFNKSYKLRFLFLKELAQNLSDSFFYDDLAKLNGWMDVKGKPLNADDLAWELFGESIEQKYQIF